MPKKKKEQTEGPEAAPANQTFSEPAAAQEAAVVNQTASQEAAQTTSQDAAPAAVGQAVKTASAAAGQVPAELVELLRSTLNVIIAQRRTQGLAITLAALTNSIKEALKKYLRHVPSHAVRDFIRSELVAQGYVVTNALVESRDGLYRAEIVVLYRNFEEIVDMIRKGRMNSFMRPIVSTDVHPGIDEKYRTGGFYD